MCLPVQKDMAAAVVVDKLAAHPRQHPLRLRLHVRLPQSVAFPPLAAQARVLALLLPNLWRWKSMQASTALQKKVRRVSKRRRMRRRKRRQRCRS